MRGRCIGSRGAALRSPCTWSGISRRDLASADEVSQLAARNGIRLGAINPTLFEDQSYKYGSLGNPDPAIRRAAINHILDSIELAKRVGSRDISLWFADGSNYPGAANIRHRRRQWFQEGLREAHTTPRARAAASCRIQAF